MKCYHVDVFLIDAPKKCAYVVIYSQMYANKCTNIMYKRYVLYFIPSVCVSRALFNCNLIDSSLGLFSRWQKNSIFMFLFLHFREHHRRRESDTVPLKIALLNCFGEQWMNSHWEFESWQKCLLKWPCLKKRRNCSDFCSKSVTSYCILMFI
jgi:hypothetical protein